MLSKIFGSMKSGIAYFFRSQEERYEQAVEEKRMQYQTNIFEYGKDVFTSYFHGQYTGFEVNKRSIMGDIPAVVAGTVALSVVNSLIKNLVKNTCE
jgi:hypothetical protein